MGDYGRTGQGRSDRSTVYDPPLRCQSCSAIIVKKPKAKTPKYCPPCRHAQQASYKQQAKKLRRH